MVTWAISGAACSEHGAYELPRAPWSIRVSRETAARPAMEVYAADTLLDVVVATPLAAGVLCGASRAVADGQRRAIAWGRLVGSSSGITVRFARRGPRGGGRTAEVMPVNDWFWVAMADGRFATVTATYQGTSERRRIVAAPPS
jgi:hypothetical protein